MPEIITISEDDLYPERGPSSDDNVIRFSEEDLHNQELRDQLKNRAIKDLILEDGSRVRLGLPPLESNGSFIPPDVPHIFEADMTIVREGRGNSVKEAIMRGLLSTVGLQVENDARGQFLNLGKCVVIYAHGISRGGGDKWFFADHQNVPQVTLAFNKFAQEHQLPEIELVAACNADRAEVDLNTNQPLSADNDIRVGAFGEQPGSPFSIAYAVGELARASGRVDKDRGIIFFYETERGDIFNIDSVIAKHEYPL